MSDHNWLPDDPEWLPPSCAPGTKPTGEKWHRDSVRGKEKWDEGKFHLAFLVNKGLKPHHIVLDLGCGSLRTGVELIPFLARGHYFGVDAEASLIEAGQRDELPKDVENEKQPTFHVSRNFDFSAFDAEMRFDYVWAYSLFTHLTPARIEQCLRAVIPRLAEPSGVFFASYNEEPAVFVGKRHAWREEVSVTRYPFSKIQEIAEKVGAQAERVAGAISPVYRRKNVQNILRFCRSV